MISKYFFRFTRTNALYFFNALYFGWSFYVGIFLLRLKSFFFGTNFLFLTFLNILCNYGIIIFKELIH